MSAINTAWIDNLTAQVNAVPDCAGLEKVVNSATAALTAQLQANANQLAQLAVLIIAPTDLPSVITYIKAQIALYEAQYANALLIEAQLTAAYTALLAAIDNKRTALNCSFTPPTFPVITPPVFPPP